MAHKTSSFASVASLLTLLVTAPLALGACSSADAPSDEKTEATDATTEAFSVHDTKILGSLAYGESSTGNRYTSRPRYRAFKFAGSAGDQVDVWVKSKHGDPVTWIVDNDWHAIAMNDDASSSDTDSHVKVTLPVSASDTHYIVVRDYWLDNMTFSVDLGSVTPDFVSGCNVDADCVAVNKACCANLGTTAIRAGEEAAYKASLACSTHQICTMMMLAPDYAAPECNRTSHTCEMVKPADIVCGGHVPAGMQHECPSGYQCMGDALAYDGPGSCVQFCGGIAAIQCHDSAQSCTDNPTDDCDPAHGGADCGGICK